MKDELIALGLAVRHSKPSATAMQNDALRAPIEKLLTLLRDFVCGIELPDEDTLVKSIEECRRAVASASDAATIMASVDACNDACRQVLAGLGRQYADQQQEIASLVSIVHEALAMVAGDGEAFGTRLGSSMKRFEALVHVSDVRQLKAQLVQEIAGLRTIAEERQKMWEETTRRFSEKVDALELQLRVTKQEAALDPLTRIANRGAFDRACRQWLSAEHVQFVLAMIDIDNFKSVNDTHGHTVGDRALVGVAQALKNSVRSKSDIVARLGGDEFAWLATDLNLRQAESRLRMLTASLSAVSFETPKHPLKLTLSCGVAECSAGDTVESLMERADTALYEAKRLGKNRVVSRAKPTLRDLLGH